MRKKFDKYSYMNKFIEMNIKNKKSKNMKNIFEYIYIHIEREYIRINRNIYIYE